MEAGEDRVCAYAVAVEAPGRGCAGWVLCARNPPAFCSLTRGSKAGTMRGVPSIQCVAVLCGVHTRREGGILCLYYFSARFSFLRALCFCWSLLPSSSGSQLYPYWTGFCAPCGGARGAEVARGPPALEFPGHNTYCLTMRSGRSRQPGKCLYVPGFPEEQGGNPSRPS